MQFTVEMGDSVFAVDCVGRDTITTRFVGGNENDCWNGEPLVWQTIATDGDTSIVARCGGNLDRAMRQHNAMVDSLRRLESRSVMDDWRDICDSAGV